MVGEELAAKRLERAQVGIVRVEDRREQLVDRGHVEVVVVGRPEPRRAEHPLEERAERRLGAGLLRVPAELRGVLAAAHPARVDEVAATRVARTVVACTCRLHLPGQEAIGAVERRALNARRVPVAGARVGEEGVGGEPAALHVARGDHRARDQAHLVGRDVAVGRRVGGAVEPQHVGVQVGAVVRRRARDDAVVVVRVALRLH